MRWCERWEPEQCWMCRWQWFSKDFSGELRHKPTQAHWSRSAQNTEMWCGQMCLLSIAGAPGIQFLWNCIGFSHAVVNQRKCSTEINILQEKGYWLVCSFVSRPTEKPLNGCPWILLEGLNLGRARTQYISGRIWTKGLIQSFFFYHHL